MNVAISMWMFRRRLTRRRQKVQKFSRRAHFSALDCRPLRFRLFITIFLWLSTSVVLTQPTPTGLDHLVGRLSRLFLTHF